MELTAHFSNAIDPNHAGGVLVASGDRHGGYTFYIREGHLHFEHVRLGDRVTVRAPLESAIRRCSVVIHVADDHSAQAILFADRSRLRQCRIPLVSTHLSFWGLDVGRDAGIPVSDAYTAPFVFPDRDLDRVVMRFYEAITAEEIAMVLEAAE